MQRFRPAVPDSVALHAALRHRQIICGCGCGEPIAPTECEREHNPALELRAYDPQTRKYSPDANDPEYIKLWRKECHDKKTHGPGGESRITTKGSDNHTARRLDRLATKHARHQAAMAAKLSGHESTEEGGERNMVKVPAKKGRKIASKAAAKKKPAKKAAK